MKRKVLKATDGMILTDGVNFGREVYLAEGADENLWYEISLEEYEQYMKAREEEHQRMYEGIQ